MGKILGLVAFFALSLSASANHQQDDIVFEADARGVAGAVTTASGQDVTAYGADGRVMVIVPAGARGSAFDWRFVASLGRVLDRVIGSYNIEMGEGGDWNWFFSTSADVSYQNMRFDLMNGGLSVKTPEGGRLAFITQLNSLHTDRMSNVLFNSQGLKIRFEQKVGKFLRAYAGGMAAVLWTGGVAGQSEASPYMIVLTKPGLRQDGAGGYFEGHFGLAARLLPHVELDVSMTGEKTMYRMYEIGLDDSRISDTRDYGSTAITGRAGVAVRF